MTPTPGASPAPRRAAAPQGWERRDAPGSEERTVSPDWQLLSLALQVPDRPEHARRARQRSEPPVVIPRSKRGFLVPGSHPHASPANAASQGWRGAGRRVCGSPSPAVLTAPQEASGAPR